MDHSRSFSSEPWFRKRHVAAHCGVTPRTINRWMAEGCPSRLFGGERRFQLSAVDDWLAARQTDDEQAA